MATQDRSAAVSRMVPERQTLSSVVDRLCASIRRGDAEEFVRLLRREIPSLHEALDSDGLSPLHVAILASRTHRKWRKMSYTLLFHRERLHLDVNIRSKHPRMLGWTALDFACAFRSPRAVRILQLHGCEAYDMTLGRLGGNNHRRKLHFDMELAKIRLIAFPTPLHPPLVTFDLPQSITRTELNDQLPLSDLDFGVQALLRSQAMFQYHPIGSRGGYRYCFPAYFPQQLPPSVLVEGKRYLVHAGRFLSPRTSKIDVQEVFIQLLTHVLTKIDDKPSVSQSAFCFQTSQGTECRVAVLVSREHAREGIQLVVRSNKPLRVSIPDACALCNHLVHLGQTLSRGTFTIDVVSSLDLHAGKPHPHVYTAREVKETREGILTHPNGGQELFLGLLLEGCNGEHTPIKPVVPDNPVLPLEHPVPPGGFEVAQRKPTCTVRKLHYYPPEYIWSKDVCHEAVFSQCYEDLVAHMLPQCLVPPLVADGYLTPQGVLNTITPSIAPRSQSMYLLSYLERSLQKATDYYRFFSILREEQEHYAHQQLERSLVQACTEIEARQQLVAKGIDFLSLSEWQPTYHPYSREESPSYSPTHSGSYSSFAPSRPDTGIHSFTHSGDYMHSRDGSVSPSTHASHNDSGAHSRPSTGNKSRHRVQVLHVRQQILNKAANDFSNLPSPTVLPPVITPHERQRATSPAVVSSSSDGSSSSDSSPFSLSLDLESSSRAASETPKHLNDETTLPARFARIFASFLCLLLQLDSLSNQDCEDRRQLLPGLGFKM